MVYAVLEQKRKILNKNPISLNDTDNPRFSRTNYEVLNLPGYEPCEKTGSAEITKVTGLIVLLFDGDAPRHVDIDVGLETDVDGRSMSSRVEVKGLGRIIPSPPFPRRRFTAPRL